MAHRRVRNTGYGKQPTLKRDGYARGPVPESMIGTKTGKTSRVGYSGPPVARPTREDF
jgi:hypothetical protein